MRQAPTVSRPSQVRSSTLRTPTEKFQGMAFYRELGLGLDKLREFLERAQHEIDDPTTPATLNMMMVLTSMPYLISHLPLAQPHWIDEAYLLEHGQIPVHSGKIHVYMGLLQSGVHLRRGDWKRVRFQDGQDGLPGLRELLPAGLQTVDD